MTIRAHPGRDLGRRLSTPDDFQLWKLLEGCEVESGLGEEALEEAGLILHPPEPGLDQRGQLAETYRRDAFQIIRSGLIGGKGVTPAVASHPAVFATFTAPSFGPVHARPVRQHTCADRS